MIDLYDAARPMRDAALAAMQRAACDCAACRGGGELHAHLTPVLNAFLIARTGMADAAVSGAEAEVLQRIVVRGIAQLLAGLAGSLRGRHPSGAAENDRESLVRWLGAIIPAAVGVAQMACDGDMIAVDGRVVDGVIEPHPFDFRAMLNGAPR
jgi:hypothetical protein